MFKFIIVLFAVVLIAVQTADARRHRRSSSFHRLPRDLTDFFQPPVPYEGCCITRGMITDQHYGIDIACGTESVGVVAMGDGDLVASCDGQKAGGEWTCEQGGNFVLIKYIVGEQPLYVYYYHLAEGSVLKAEPGTRLKKGQQVGMTGTTGKSNGVHLDVTSQKNPPTDFGRLNPDSTVDFRQMLEMDHWPACS